MWAAKPAPTIAKGWRVSRLRGARLKATQAGWVRPPKSSTTKKGVLILEDDLFYEVDAAREAREERAAIVEYEGGMTRAEAEALAREMTEEFRHRCECQEYARWPRDKVVQQMKGIQGRRGRDAALRIWRDVQAIWSERDAIPAGA